MKFISAMTVAILLASGSASAHAVYLNPHSLGQVLIYPYYTVNGGNGTLVSIVNTTARGKAVKVRFHEGYDGRAVLDFNVYLAPHATWAGQVVDRQGNANAPAGLITNDSSCTVPAFSAPTGPGTLSFLDFSGASYAGTNTPTGPTGNSDGGPLGLDRTREGHFDVIEMGEVTNASQGSLDAITPTSGGVPSNCAKILAAWANGGYWTQDGTVDLAPPAGGLYGSEAVINVAQGTLYSVSPEIIEDFSTAIQHTAPGAAVPDLNTASKSADGTVSARVALNGKMLELDYQNPVDAISALFMTESLYGEFSIDSNIGASTDWVVTAPTKRYYVDPMYIGKPTAVFQTAAPPFLEAFLFTYVAAYINNNFAGASAYPYACDLTNAVAYDRAGAATPLGHQNPGNPNPGTNDFETSQMLRPCLETSVLTFSAKQREPNGGWAPVSALDSKLTNASDPYGISGMAIVIAGPDVSPFPNGNLHLDLTHSGVGNAVAQHQLSPAANGDVLIGLPVIGFRATNYVNDQVLAGVLANYSGLYPLHINVKCTNAKSVNGACI